MEASSPLAAIRPAPPSFSQPEVLGPRNGNLAPPTGLFNFKRSNADLFNTKHAGRSSPKGSLVTGSSENFKLNEAGLAFSSRSRTTDSIVDSVDQMELCSSPLLPTPRRSLFTSTGIENAVEGRGYATTPPPPASSSPAVNRLDMSPVPIKAPFLSRLAASPSPAAVDSGDEDTLPDSPAAVRQLSQESKGIGAERRRLGLSRPPLARAKGYSTSSIPGRSNGSGSGLPPFRFGGRNLKVPISPSVSLSLSECFEESPPQERRTPVLPGSPCSNAAAARCKTHFGSGSNINSVRKRSPTNNARTPSNPFARQRKTFRRSLSMFESPGDIVKSKERTSLPSSLKSVVDVNEPQEPLLPHFFPSGENDSIPRISRDTLLEVLDGKYGSQYSHRIIIDCRFEYEYEGGHIDGAINYNDKELLARHLFETPMEGRTLLIFHCEYSAHRAPIMARHIRSEDRTINAEFYPKLTYPDVYILDGGYSGFFQNHRERCCPQAYIEMNDAEHVNTCEREMGRLRQTRKGFSRAQTYAFGQRERKSDKFEAVSPTAPGRKVSRDDEEDMIGASPILGNDRSHSRRMATF
ncbi:hypothetical protein QR685DRAFT_319034 [Neurospora intermedia]|uniref:M-phase inducer phosphatase n=1 Tax=Neurospora intermedia TaxID=5142 RepID=A0ABR3D894_NEUIN